MVKYNANWEITNTYENLQIVRSQFFTKKLIFIYISFSVKNWNQIICKFSFVFVISRLSSYFTVFICLIWISIGLLVYKWIAIQLHLTNPNIRSAIRWAITKVILNYSPLPTLDIIKVVKFFFRWNSGGDVRRDGLVRHQQHFPISNLFSAHCFVKLCLNSNSSALK
jgi:hypothetical protein